MLKPSSCKALADIIVGLGAWNRVCWCLGHRYQAFWQVGVHDSFLKLSHKSAFPCELWWTNMAQSVQPETTGEFYRAYDNTHCIV